MRTLAHRGAAAVIVVLAYPIWLQFFGPDHVVIRGAIHGTDIYVTDPANFVVPTVAQLIIPQVATSISSHFSGNASEWDAYLGIPLILVLWSRPFVSGACPQIRIAGVMALVIAILSLGPHINVRRTSTPRAAAAVVDSRASAGARRHPADTD